MLKLRKYNIENFTYSYLHSFCLTEHLTVKTNFELISRSSKPRGWSCGWIIPAVGKCIWTGASSQSGENDNKDSFVSWWYVMASVKVLNLQNVNLVWWYSFRIYVIDIANIFNFGHENALKGQRFMIRP